MSRILRFKTSYFFWTLVIFTIEVLIAVFVDDRFIRPYAGDFLVAILVYCFLRSFLDIAVIKLAIAALLFCYLVETLQYLNILDKLHLNKSRVARTVLGSSFEWTDMLAYTLGIVFVLYLEKVTGKKRTRATMINTAKNQ